MKRKTKLISSALIVLFSCANLTGCFTDCPSEDSGNCATVRQLAGGAGLIAGLIALGAHNTQEESRESGNSSEE